VSTVSHRDEPQGGGYIGALRRLRDPLLLFVVPVAWAVLVVVVGYLPAWGIGFDFVGTLWEPGRAFLHGESMYPEPVRASIVIGNPSVYPPPSILATLPLAVLPQAVGAWTWFVLLGIAVIAAMWLVGVRDWRCHVLAVTSPVVVHGLVFGNVTILLVLLVAVAWRYRGRPLVAGVAVGAAVAAKLFVWPLVVWLILTRRYLAAAWAVGSTVLLIAVSWAVVGFDGLTDYPRLLNAVQDVYATHSASIATATTAFGSSFGVSIAACWVVAFALLFVAALVARSEDGDRRVFTVVVVASIVGSTIVWPNYASLLLVPIAVTWPRLAPVWFFGYVVWVAGLVVPKTEFVSPCCRPADVPVMAWAWSHSTPLPWYAAGILAVVLAVGALTLFAGHASRHARRFGEREVTS
jgi:hypothetical protein